MTTREDTRLSIRFCWKTLTNNKNTHLSCRNHQCVAGRFIIEEWFHYGDHADWIWFSVGSEISHNIIIYVFFTVHSDSYSSSQLMVFNNHKQPRHLSITQWKSVFGSLFYLMKVYDSCGMWRERRRSACSRKHAAIEKKSLNEKSKR